MGQFTISITKRVAFRDWTQEFSNVYTYTATAANPDNAGALALIDELVAAEKQWHSTGVTFVLGRCWSSGGSVSSNVMIAEKTLTGNGAVGDNTAMDRERAYLIEWPAGFDSRGKPVYLRKWYHACCSIAGVAITNGMLANQTGFSSANRTAIANLICPLVEVIGPSNQWILSAVSGRQFQSTGFALKYLEHHQLGD